MFFFNPIKREILFIEVTREVIFIKTLSRESKLIVLKNQYNLKPYLCRTSAVSLMWHGLQRRASFMVSAAVEKFDNTSTPVEFSI